MKRKGLGWGHRGARHTYKELQQMQREGEKIHGKKYMNRMPKANPFSKVTKGGPPEFADGFKKVAGRKKKYFTED